MHAILSSRNKKVNFVIDICGDIIGTFLYAIAVHMFTAPNQIAPGGVTGLATLTNFLTGFPIGLISFLINVPLLLLGFKFIGRKFTLRTLLTVALSTVMIDVVVRDFPTFTGDMLMAALAGGVIMGIGLGIIFMRGSTTGGTDIVARLLQRKWPHMQMGRLMLIIDCVVLLIAAAVYRNMESALYGAVCIFASSLMIDGVLYGTDKGKMAMVVSDTPDQVSKAILDGLDRGVTLLEGEGAYTGDPKKIIMCAVRPNQFYKLKQIALEADPNAFIIALDTSEVFGEGFKREK
ncbi:YitT family protein [Zongyangia hominis]|uniref:YitT family protein n=1 Tax=Zongyangia hominis TaxID=2763677 RepID=A0A926IAT7_9FIRM|nr:YitT family protein [Zongyangia hominis]MBC8569445.1 YitT family protein [Zongyangia hominis]